MFIIFFSLPYFSVMSDAGLFDTIVEFLLKKTKLSVVAGVLSESGMMDAMVQFLINIIAVCAAGNL